MVLKNLFGLACGFGLLAATSAFAALPKSTNLVADMGMGYNIGNTMEVPKDPTGWGNPLPTKEYIKAIKAAGFNTVRIPCAWYSHSDALTKDIAKYGSEDNSTYKHVGADASFTTPTIDATWLAQVKEVVDMIIAEGMYVVLNSHWDEGWLEDRVYNGTENPRANAGDIANSSATTEARQKAYWTQIATYFKAYDEHLLFAGANEPGVNDPWGSSGQWSFDNARMKILQGYYNAFISAVRTAGGNNDTRTLIVQAPRTEMDMATMLNSNMPTDPAGSGYMMVEVHYYPYQYSLMTADESWGKQFYYYSGLTSTTDAAHNMTNGALGSPTQISKAFGELKTMFCDKGIPVIIGELGAIKRTDQISGDNLKLHLQGRALFYGEVAKNAKANGIVPYVWDTGSEGDGNMTFITRQKGTYEVFDGEVLDAMRKAYGMTALGNTSIGDIVEQNPEIEEGTGTAVELTYATKSDEKSETGTIRINLTNKDLSKYVGLEVRLKGSVQTAGGCTSTEPEDKCSEYGWTSIDLFMMDGSWNWYDVNLVENPDQNLSTAFEKVQVMFADFRTDPTEALKTINSIGINLYGTQVTGTVVIDYIAGINADGSTTVIDDFEKKPSVEGIVSAKITSIATDAIKPAATIASKMFVNVQQGYVNATFSAATAGMANVKLINSLGQVIASQNFSTHAGNNTVQLTAGVRGPAFLMVKQGSQQFMQKVILK